MKSICNHSLNLPLNTVPLNDVGRKKKTESDNDQVSVDHKETDCYIIAENHQSLSKSVIRHEKLKSRKTVEHTVSFKIPSLLDIQNGKWLNDVHNNAANDLFKSQFPSVSGLHDPKYGQIYLFLILITLLFRFYMLEITG